MDYKRRKLYLEPDSKVEIPRQTFKRIRNSEATASTSRDHPAVETDEDTQQARRDEDFLIFDDHEDPVGEGDAQQERCDDNQDPVCDEDNIFQASFFEKYNVPLFNGVSTTKAEALILIMRFALLHNLPWSTIEMLLTLINSLFGQDVLPSSKYLFTKLFGGMNSCFTFHFYCVQCLNYLGRYESKLPKDKIITCPSCSIENLVSSLKENNFFVTLDIRAQLKHLFQREDVGLPLMNNFEHIKSHDGDSISDIFQGKFYKNLQPTLQDQDITITFNVDGSPVFKSSRCAIWPIQFVVNELPPHLRWDNVLIAGLWVGAGHVPDMNLFTNAFVEDIKQLTESPVQWNYLDKIMKSRVFCICACVDSPARAMLQNTVQYNGYFGCSWCLDRGKQVNGCVKYPVQHADLPEDRTEEQMIRDMTAAQMSSESGRPKSVNGVKGPSALINMPGFHIVDSFAPDYMHSINLGVTTQFLDMWFSDTNEEHYIGSPSSISLVDEKLLKIKPPHQFSRLPRSIMDRRYWKASEKKLWGLYYSIPCLYGILPNKYLLHFKLLVEACYLLLQESITRPEVRKADELLSQFVVQTQILYGEAAMTSNVHQLLHIPKSVLLFGPLWAHSAYVFEGNMGKLLNMVTAAKGVLQQILNRYSFSRRLQEICSIDIENLISTKVKALCNTLPEKAEVQNCTPISHGIYALGVGKSDILSPAEEEAFLRYHDQVPEVVHEFNRIILKNKVYHSCNYNRSIKSNNTIVKLKDGSFGKIIKFFVYFNGNDEVCCIMINKFNLSSERTNFLPPHIKKCSGLSQNIFFFPVTDIVYSCLVIDFQNVSYICEIPNRYERD